MTTPEKIVENASLAALSRLSMLATPVLLGVLGWFVVGLINEVRADVDDLSLAVPAADKRIVILETNMTRGREDREEFQVETARKLDAIQTMLTAVLQEQASLRATMQHQQREIDRRR